MVLICKRARWTQGLMNGPVDWIVAGCEGQDMRLETSSGIAKLSDAVLTYFDCNS